MKNIVVNCMTYAVCITLLAGAATGQTLSITATSQIENGTLYPIVFFSNSTSKVIKYLAGGSYAASPEMPLYELQTLSTNGWSRFPLPRSNGMGSMGTLKSAQSVGFRLEFSTNVPWRVGIKYEDGDKTNDLWSQTIKIVPTVEIIRGSVHSADPR
jgi:hypothetical protein